MLLQHSLFCAIPPSLTVSLFTPSLKQRNPFLHHLSSPRKPKASTFRISSLGPGFFDEIVQIAHNKVPHFKIQSLYVSQILGSFQILIFPFFFLFLWSSSSKVLIAAGVSLAIGQLSKPFTSVFLYGKEFDIRVIVQAGGFPSSHSSVWPCNP